MQLELLTGGRLRDEILTGDIRTLRKADIAACEIQTGDMGTPTNRASYQDQKIVDVVFGSMAKAYQESLRNDDRK